MKAKPIINRKGYENIQTVFISGFGVCFYAKTTKKMPKGGKGMKYYGTKEGYRIYGTNEKGINKYLPSGRVEFWATPK